MIVCVIGQTLDVAITTEVEGAQNEPFISAFGKPGEEKTQYFICAEQSLLTESSSLRDALLDLICYYYVFNVSYPKSISGVFLFIQHIVCNLKDSQKHPNSLTKLLKNIQ